MKKSKFRAFTILELAVVIIIISILSSVGYMSYIGSKARANYSKIVSDMEGIKTAALLYRETNHAWPLDQTGDSLSSTGIQSFLMQQEIPAPPCPTWWYDWDNWADQPHNNNIVRLSLRNSDDADLAVIINCSDPGISPEKNCKTPAENLAEITEFVNDIHSIESRKVTCQESGTVSLP